MKLLEMEEEKARCFDNCAMKLSHFLSLFQEEDGWAEVDGYGESTSGSMCWNCDKTELSERGVRL